MLLSFFLRKGCHTRYITDGDFPRIEGPLYSVSFLHLIPWSISRRGPMNSAKTSTSDLETYVRPDFLHLRHLFISAHSPSFSRPKANKSDLSITSKAASTDCSLNVTIFIFHSKPFTIFPQRRHSCHLQLIKCLQV